MAISVPASVRNGVGFCLQCGRALPAVAIGAGYPQLLWPTV